MSFHEKSNIVMLAILAGVFGWYFAGVLPHFGTLEAPPPAAFGGLLVFLTLLLIALSIVAHVAIKIFAMKESDNADERDRLIEMRADARAGYVLAAGVFGAIALTVMDVAPFWSANALLAALVLSELTKGVLRAWAYRFGG